MTRDDEQFFKEMRELNEITMKAVRGETVLCPSDAYNGIDIGKRTEWTKNLEN